MTRRRVMLGLLLVLSTLLLVSRLVPRVTRLEVTGIHHLSEEEVFAKANLKLNDPFVWVTRPRFRPLARDPWVARVEVTRRWPDTVYLTVQERVPFVSEDERVYALDGTFLPSTVAAEAPVTLRGWGPDRRDEAFELLRLLEVFEPEMLSYSPSGFEVRMAHTELFTPSAEALRAQWSGFLSQQGSEESNSLMAVYPWGVSVKHD